MYEVHTELVDVYEKIPCDYREAMEDKFGKLYGFTDDGDSSGVHLMQAWVSCYFKKVNSMSKFFLMWTGYRKRVMHPECSSVQIKECKQAFYAGALSMFDAMTVPVNAGLSLEEGADYIEQLRQEMENEIKNMIKDEHD